MAQRSKIWVPTNDLYSNYPYKKLHSSALPTVLLKMVKCFLVSKFSQLFVLICSKPFKETLDYFYWCLLTCLLMYNSSSSSHLIYTLTFPHTDAHFNTFTYIRRLKRKRLEKFTCTFSNTNFWMSKLFPRLEYWFCTSLFNWKTYFMLNKNNEYLSSIIYNN